MTKKSTRVQKAMAEGKAIAAEPFSPDAVAGDTPSAAKQRGKAKAEREEPVTPPEADPDDPGAEPDGLDHDDDLAPPGGFDEAEQIIARFCEAMDQNDRDNGRRLIAWFGDSLAYVTGLGWLVWRGTHWLRDEADLDVRLMAQEIVDRIKLETYLIEPTPAEARTLAGAKRALAKPEAELTAADRIVIAKSIGVRKSISTKRSKRRAWAVTSGNAGKTTAMLQQAQSLKSLPIEKLDADQMKFNVRNGTLRFWRELDPERPEGSDRKMGCFEFEPHDRADMITKLADVDYVEGAACPFFDSEFLKKVQPAEKMRLFLQVSTAYALLLGGNDEQRLFYHYGTGANGKSAYLELIGRMAGTYRSIASPDTVTGDGQRQGQQANPDIARLHNTRLVTIEELPKNVPLREELIKALTGGTKILARFLNKDFFEFMPIFTPMLSGNSKPAISGADYGIWRRVLLILWGVTIPVEERLTPTLLAEKLDAERSGILNWLIEGLMLYLKHGLEPFVPAEVTAFTQDYREERDNVGVFVEAALEAAPGEQVKAGVLYDAYLKWCEVNALRAASHRSFGDSLTEKGFKKKRGNYIVYLDVRLLPTASKFDPVTPPPRDRDDPGPRPEDFR